MADLLVLYLMIIGTSFILGLIITYALLKVLLRRRGEVGEKPTHYVNLLARVIERGVTSQEDFREFPPEVVRAFLEDCKEKDLIKEYGTTSKLYITNYGNVWRTLHDMFSNVNAFTAIVTDYRDKIIILEDEHCTRLADLGVKSIGVIEFDPIEGPMLKYVAGVTNLVKRMLMDPNETVRIHMAAQEANMIETEKGEKLILARFFLREEERVSPAVVFAEITLYSQIDSIRDIINGIANELNNREAIRKEDVEQLILDNLRG